MHRLTRQIDLYLPKSLADRDNLIRYFYAVSLKEEMRASFFRGFGADQKSGWTDQPSVQRKDPTVSFLPAVVDVAGNDPFENGPRGLRQIVGDRARSE